MSSIAKRSSMAIASLGSFAGWAEMRPDLGGVQPAIERQTPNATPEQPAPEGTAQAAPERLADSDESGAGDVNKSLRLFRLPEQYVVQRVLVGNIDATRAEAAEATVDDERLVYRSTRGKLAVSIPTTGFLADDLALLSAPGCQLRRYSFQVTGRADPAVPIRGPYQVEFALYDDCPSAGGRIIPHTIDVVQIPADQDSIVQQVEFIANRQLDIPLPSTVWLGLKPDRGNVGVVLGAPTEMGFSADRVDYPGFICNAAGGFPWHPQASFNAELWVDGACPAAFPGYRNSQPGRGGFTEGSNRCIADDLKLGSHPCDMIAYEVHVRGVGFYRFALREDADGLPGAVVPRTSVSRSVPLAAGGVQLLRFSFDPPIALPKEVWMTFQCSNPGAGWTLTRKNADIGDTAPTYAHSPSGTSCATVNDWAEKHPADPTAYGGFDVTILCAGAPPLGACCDMYQPNENGDVVCSETPGMNCPFPGTNLPGLEPHWIQGARCDPDPFPHPCGQSACCKPDDTCENLTRNDCDAVEPVDAIKGWQRGQFCDEGFQDCPFSACIQAREADDCRLPHENSGCVNPFCCEDVCALDPFCCTHAWDRLCVDEALESPWCQYSAVNNHCAAEDASDHGALQIGIPSTTTIDGRYAESSSTDPPFCCNMGFPRTCVGGDYANLPCDTNRHCPEGVCRNRVIEPATQAANTVWFKFAATRTSAQLHTLFSDPDTLDTLLQVFSVADPTTDETACNSLTPIACNDDALGDDGRDKRSKLCVKDLVPGRTYYVLVGAKYLTSSVLYRLNIVSPCPNTDARPLNDFCTEAATLHDLEPVRFDLRAAQPDCPLGACGAFAKRDLWYEYTVPRDGRVKITVHSPDRERPVDLSVAIYRGCNCPVSGNALIACASNEVAQPTEPDGLTFPVLSGQCYKIRLGNDFGDKDPSLSSGAILNGDLQAECISCPSGPVNWMDPPSGLIDARRSYSTSDYYCGKCSEGCNFDGIQEFLVSAPVGAHPSCWRICQTNANPALHQNCPGVMSANDILSVRETEPGLYSLLLETPLIAGEVTTIAYVADSGEKSQGTFMSFAADVNGNRATDEDDLAALIACCLEERCASSWGAYSCDIDASGQITPADLLEAIDLLNGARNYPRWNGAEFRSEVGDCPHPAP